MKKKKIHRQIIFISGLLSKCEEDDELGEGEVAEGLLTFKGEYGLISENCFSSQILITAVIYLPGESNKTILTYFK